MHFNLSPLGLLYIFIAGMIGALFRFLIIECITRIYDKTLEFLPYPHHTFVVNVIACFIMGLSTAHFALDPPKYLLVRSLVITGFLGAFSTFSTYIADIVMHLKEKQTTFAVIYCIMTLVISFAAGMLGRFLAGGFS